MKFVIKKWDDFCRSLSQNQVRSIPANSVQYQKDENYLVLKHDVEAKVRFAFRIASIEAKYGHKGSYYVQAYLLQNKKNVELLKKMQSMGHEISYHYDVLDACKGNFEEADREFKNNLDVFHNNGFLIETVCQHGNPVVERNGYTSNRDFFRNEIIREKYSGISDIMVNFKQKYNTDYLYFSDAGRHFQLIYDPLENDLHDSSENNVIFDSTSDMWDYIRENSTNSIISIHPHRWERFGFIYTIKLMAFSALRFLAKAAMRIPLLKRIMSKFYYLAKIV